MPLTISRPAYTALGQWMLKLGGYPLLAEVVVAQRGARAADTDRLLSEASALERAFAERLNTLNLRHDAVLLRAYRELGVHPLSDWEQTEIQLDEDVRRGRYDAWDTAKEGASLFAEDLLLLVVHGHFDRARPLLARYANENPGTIDALWLRWIAEDRLDVAEASRLAQPSGTPLTVSATTARRLPLAFVASDLAVASAALASGSTPKERELSPRPVKSLPKLLAQLLASWRGELPVDVLRKSFHSFFANSYHHESPSDLPEKIGVAYLYGHAIESRPAHELVAGIKSHLPMFTAARRAARRVYVADVEPVTEALRVLGAALREGKGLVIRDGEKEVELVAEEGAVDRDFF